MIKPGNTAPDFILPDENGNEVSLAELLRNGPLILFFYPADFTPSCTKEVCEIRDLHDQILSVGLQVVGISPQDGDSHGRFRDEHDLPFILLCDEAKVAIKMYDANGPLGMGVRRITYLITQGQKIQDALQADFRIDRHKEFIEKAIMLREVAGMKIASSE